MSDLPPVARALAELHVPYKLFVHAGPVHSLEQAARERQQQPDQVIRSIVFRVGKAEFLMVLMAGERQIAWPALRRYLGQSRLTMATEDEVRRVTGYERGAVAPFGLPQPLKLLADPSVFEHEEISLGSGVRGTAVMMASGDLRRALGEVEIVDLSSGPADHLSQSPARLARPVLGTMDDYRIFVGAFPEGELAERIQAVRVEHDPRTARITAPHVTLAGTYWRNGSPTPESEARTIEQLRSIEDQLQPFEMQIHGVDTFLPHNPVIFLHIEPAPNLLAVRRVLVQAIGSDKHRSFTPHLTLTMRLEARQTETLLKQLRQTDWLLQPMSIPIDHLWLMQRGSNDPAWRYIQRVEMRA